MLGRPTDYTEELADYICEQIATSTKSVRALALSDGRLPEERNIYHWMYRYPGFRLKYLEAKEAQALWISEKIMDDAYNVEERNEAIAKQNLVFRVGQWHLAKLAPKQFGDKKESNVTLNVHEDSLKNLK